MELLKTEKKQRGVGAGGGDVSVLGTEPGAWIQFPTHQKQGKTRSHA